MENVVNAWIGVENQIRVKDANNQYVQSQAKISENRFSKRFPNGKRNTYNQVLKVGKCPKSGVLIADGHSFAFNHWSWVVIWFSDYHH